MKFLKSFCVAYFLFLLPSLSFSQIFLSIEYGVDFVSNEVQVDKSFVYKYSANFDYKFRNRFSFGFSLGKIENVEQQGSGRYLSNLLSSSQALRLNLQTRERINMSVINIDAISKIRLYKNLKTTIGISFFQYSPVGYLNYSVSETLGNEISSGNIGIIEYESTWNNRLKIGLEYLFSIRSINVGPYFSLYYNKDTKQFNPSSITLEGTEYVTEEEFYFTTGNGFKHRTELWFAGIRFEYSLFK